MTDHTEKENHTVKELVGIACELSTLLKEKTHTPAEQMMVMAVLDRELSIQATLFVLSRHSQVVEGKDAEIVKAIIEKQKVKDAEPSDG